MYIEEQIKAIQEENKILKAEIEQLKKYGTVRYVTPKELAELMNCSLQNVHNKIRNGSIQVTRKLGAPRIPMNQFLEADNIIEFPKARKRREEKEPTMAEQIFG